MHTKALLTVAVALIGAAFSATAARASEATPDYPIAYTSNVTRDGVQAEALRARATGLIAEGERSLVIADAGPSKTRAQVKAETLEAIRVGAIGHGEQSDFPTAMQLQSARQAGLKALLASTRSCEWLLVSTCAPESKNPQGV